MFEQGVSRKIALNLLDKLAGRILHFPFTILLWQDNQISMMLPRASGDRALLTSARCVCEMGLQSSGRRQCRGDFDP
jgi:hypothetical protein